MPDFKKYKPYSIRLKHYNYSSQGEYFVTICTKDMVDYFGEINEKHEIVLSKMGKITEKELLKTERIRKEVKIEIYAIMPNHVHTMIVIDPIVETCRGMSLQEDNFENKFSKPQKNSLSMIANHFKGAVMRYAKENNIPFQWQPGYYDEIIKNEKHYSEIYDYILSNPLKWDEDKNNPKNIKL